MKKFLYSFLAVILLVWTCGANVIADSDGGISSEVSADYSNGKYGSEVYYLANRACGGISKSDIAVFKRNGTPVAVWYELDERCRERELTEAEYNEFVLYIQKLDADTLPDFIPSEHGHMVCDGSEHKYIHISNGTKSEVYMNNPQGIEYEDKANLIYNSIIDKFKSLFKTGKIKTYYDIDGAELLINNEDHCVRSVYKNGDDFRVLIKDRENSTYDYEKLEWHSFKNNVVGDIVDEPDGFTMEKAWEGIPKDSLYTYREHLNSYPWQSSWGDYMVKIKSGEKYGLYLVKEGEEPILVAPGIYSHPITVPGTDFVVCEEAPNGWTALRKLVKINLKTFEKTYIDFPESKSVSPRIYLNNKVLIGCKTKDDKYEQYMYDAINDTMEEVSGDFRCMSFLKGRNLQPTSEPNKYYVLKDQYTIGIFDAEIYSITNFVKSPVLIYDNDCVWIDEQENKMYIEVNNDLISLPIKKSLSDEIYDIEVILNGEKLEFDDPLFIRNDRTLVPFRKVFEALGYEVSWKDTDESIYAEKSNNIICLHIDNPNFLVNYKVVSSDTAPELINSIAYVPLRIICEYSDCDVLWQEEDRTVIINSK